MSGTNVPPPTFGPLGFVEPAESAVLEGVQDDMNAAFGGNLNFGTTSGSLTNPTPQGQLASSLAALVGNVNDTFLFYTTQTDPAFAEGRMQDAIGRIYFIERNPPVPTTLQLNCVGATGTLIPLGAQVVDQAGNLYGCSGSAFIPISGQITLSFICQTTGAISIPSASGISIYQAIPGWDTVSLVSGVVGVPVESRAAFEARRALSTAQNSNGSLPSIFGAVLSVPGVTNAYVTENDSSSPVNVGGGLTLLPNSVYVCVAGGNNQAVAQAIWSRKAPGAAYNGNVTVQVQDTSPGYSLPFPTYSVSFQTPSLLPILFSVNMVNNPLVPANATSLIQTAIINAFAGMPNALGNVDGPAESIGAKIWASRFVPSIAALGTWAAGQVILIQVGSSTDADAASCTGSCGGTSFVVGTLITGAISAGMTLSDGSNGILPGTTIVSQVSGTMGGSGVYTISPSQTFPTITPIGLSTPDQNSTQAFINQLPTVNAANIVVTYT